MAIDNIREWSYSCAIPVWYVYESTGFHLGNIGLNQVAMGEEAMPSPEERLTIMKAENRAMEAYLGDMPQDRWNQPSMCAEWTVADVIGHLTSTNRLFARFITESLDDGTARRDSPPQRTNTRIDASVVAQHAIALRKELGDRLLPEYAKANRNLEHTMDAVGPNDWDKLCHRTMGAEPIENIIDMFIVDVGVHRWDATYPFDKNATFSEDGLPVMIERYPYRPRWWDIDLPEDPPGLPVRFRLNVNDMDVVGTDFIIEADGEKRMEPSGEHRPDVAFACDAQMFVLLTYGRITPSSAIENGTLTFDGDPVWAQLFVESFIGG